MWWMFVLWTIEIKLVNDRFFSWAFYQTLSKLCPWHIIVSITIWATHVVKHLSSNSYQKTCDAKHQIFLVGILPNTLSHNGIKENQKKQKIQIKTLTPQWRKIELNWFSAAQNLLKQYICFCHQRTCSLTNSDIYWEGADD